MSQRGSRSWEAVERLGLGAEVRLGRQGPRPGAPGASATPDWLLSVSSARAPQGKQGPASSPLPTRPGEFRGREDDRFGLQPGAPGDMGALQLACPPSQSLQQGEASCCGDLPGWGWLWLKPRAGRPPGGSTGRPSHLELCSAGRRNTPRRRTGPGDAPAGRAEPVSVGSRPAGSGPAVPRGPPDTDGGCWLRTKVPDPPLLPAPCPQHVLPTFLPSLGRRSVWVSLQPPQARHWCASTHSGHHATCQQPPVPQAPSRHSCLCPCSGRHHCCCMPLEP